MASADPAAADSLLPGNILNSFRPANANAATVGAHGSDVPLSERLRRCSLNIQANWVAGRDATSVVDYNGLEASAEWQEFLGLTAELTFIPPEPDEDPAEPPARQNVMPADVTERKAFLINLYNVLMMHGVLAKKCHTCTHEDGAAAGRHPIREMQENAGAANFFRQTAYEVDGVRLSLDDIEHGLLRGSVNKDWVATKWSPSRLDLGKAGPLFRSWVVPELDGRIHFALNCGAKGCPMIQVYNAKNLERGLEGAARSFLRAETKVLVDAPVSSTQLQVEASMLFKWYGSDFGSTDAERILFLQKYLAVEEAEKISSALKEAGSGAELVFRPYDWSLNSAD